MLLNNVFLMSAALLALTSRAAKSFEMIIISRVLVGINAGMSKVQTFRHSDKVKSNIEEIPNRIFYI